jgi:hypothetical protein
MKDDDVSRQDADDSPPSRQAAATAIVKCLGMLAEEAETMGLSRTLAALRQTIEICNAESAVAWGFDVAVDESDVGYWTNQPTGSHLN